jgi:Tfp pilus assembly protein PilZ
MSAMNDKRREPRVRFELTVTLTAGRRTWSLTTHDVSYRGMFVAIPDPPRARELVRVDARLPEGVTLTLHGMIAFVTQLGDEMGRPPGAGVQFFGSGGQEHRDWEAFVRQVWEEQHRRKVKASRQHARISIVLRLRAKDTAELEDMVATSLSQGGMFIETDHHLAVGSTMALEIVHPHTGETFDVACVVRRQAKGTDVKGVGVEFDLEPDGTRLLSEFISSGANSVREPRKE